VENGEIVTIVQNIYNKIDASSGRIHSRLDKIVEEHNKTTQRLGKTWEQLEQVKSDRPCAEVKQLKVDHGVHEERHETMKRNVIRVLIGIAITVGSAMVLYHLMPAG